MQKAIIITAPSGAGKTTLVKRLLATREDLAFSISACTRNKRPLEVNGKDYYFLSLEEFRTKADNGEFAEWEEVYDGMCYGTLLSEIERIWALGKGVIFDIDVKGAVNLKKQLGEKALSIFIKAPSQDVLRKRLLGRGTENAESFKKRFDKALYEMEFEKDMDTNLINDDLDEAFLNLNNLVENFLYS